MLKKSMVFWSILSLLPLAAPSSFGELPKVDANGQGGANGKNGQSHSSSGGGYGSRGSDGGHAGPAQSGTDAGDIEVRLENGAAPGIVRLTGVISRQGNGRNKKEPIQFEGKIGSSGSIVLEANGGRGGDGGHGGRGQDGSPGSDGADATQYSHGENGGRGGDGGNGGNGTSGGSGGDGAAIAVEVDAAQTGLLLLIEHSEKGGSGGAAGRNGGGGSGGRGGRGGESHTWETYTDSTETYTDSEGKAQTRSVTITHTHHNPGGRDGSDGDSGSSGSASVGDGPRGRDGSYRVRVRDGAGIKEYPERYNLVLDSYAVENADENGIFEFGETAAVGKISVRNAGQMATPANYEIHVFLRASGRVMPDDKKLILPKSLAPGETYVFPETLEFHVADFRDEEVARPGERLVVADQVSPAAEMRSGINRKFPDFDRVWKFQITFPVEISAIRALPALSPGEHGKVVFTVKNISSKNFGSESELKRKLMTRLGLRDSEVSEKQLRFYDEGGQPVSLEDGYFKAIANLKAGEERVVEGSLSLGNDAPAYKSIRLRSSLLLGGMQDPDAARAAQSREFEIRVGQTYTKSADADILLIPNQGTTSEEIAFWRGVAGRIGKKIDIWDLSIQGFLSLFAPLKGGSSLARDWEGKTIILLNNEVPIGDGRHKAWPAEFLSREDLLKAASSGAGGPNINFLIWGPTSRAENSEDLMRSIMLPVPGRVGGEYGSISRYMEAMGDGDAQALDLEHALADQVSVEHSFFRWWKRPLPGNLESHAQRLSRAILRDHPDKRFLLVTRFDPKKTGFGRWSLGRIEVRRTLDNADNAVVIAEAPENRMHKPLASDAEYALQSLFLGMNFSERVGILKEFMRHGTLLEVLGGESALEAEIPEQQMADALIDSMLVDLATEQAALRQEKWRGGLSRKKIREHLPKLSLLAEYKYYEMTTPGLDNPEARAALRLAGGLQFLSARMETWFDNLISMGGLLPIRRNSAVSRVTEEHLDLFVRNLFTLDTAKDRRRARKAIDREIVSWVRRLDGETGGGSRDQVVPRLMSLLNSKNVTGDSEVYRTPEDRVLTGKQFDQSNEEQEERSRRRGKLMGHNERAECDLLLRSERVQQGESAGSDGSGSEGSGHPFRS